MATQVLTKTWAQVDTITDNADAGNIGKEALIAVADLNALTEAGFFNADAAANSPAGVSFSNCINHPTTSPTSGAQTLIDRTNSTMYFRKKASSVWGSWVEIYHTGNTGTTTWADSAPSGDSVNLGSTIGKIALSRVGTASKSVGDFYNDNGLVGSIATSGTTTAYNVSSDPRLKDFKGQPIDEEIDDKFSQLFSCFDTFNWKSDPDGVLVWGFDAHACIDAGLDMGTEGEGSRELALGEVYQERVVDEEGVETQPELKVSPAGIDQAKAVPILLAKIEQLERRLAALEA